MLTRFWIPTLAIVLVAVYVISRDRKIEFEVELKVEPKDQASTD